MTVAPISITPGRLAGRLAGKVALVTGGSNGFGEAIVRHFAAEGAKVMIFDLNTEAGEAVASSSKDGSIAFVQGDVSKLESWENALKATIEKFGHLNILVNNAGISRNGAAHELPEAQFDLMLNIHLKALFWSVQVMFPHLAEQNSAAVINIGSTGATRPRPGFTWYNMTKGGILVATKSLAVEYAPKIRVNCIVPAIGNTSMLNVSFGGKKPTEDDLGWVKKMIPMGRITEPSDIANAAVFLASDEASFVTGTILDVDGGRGI